MSIHCRCLLIREGETPIWSDKILRLPPRPGDSVQFEEQGTTSTFRITEVMHTPALDGVDFGLVLQEWPGTRGRPLREVLEAMRSSP